MDRHLHRLIDGVARRRCLHRLTARFLVVGVIGAALFALLILVTRLGGLAPETSAYWQLALIPGLALACCLLPWPRLNRSDAARAVDEHLKSDDLVLTTLALERSLGEYQELVARDAYDRVRGVRAGEVVALQSGRPLLTIAVMLLLLAGMIALVPSLDPFGIEEQRLVLSERKAKKKELARLAAERKKQLEAEKVEKPNAPAVAQALNEMKKELGSLQPQRPVVNDTKIREQKKGLGDLYKKAKDERLGDVIRKAQNQNLGGDRAMEKAVNKALSKGDDKDFKQAVAEMKDLVDQINKAKDPTEKKQLQKKLQKKIKQAQNALGQQPGLQGLNNALARAMKQAAMNELDGFDPKDAQALKDGLEAAKLEMAKLAQGQRDLQKLEEAMKLLQQAQQLNKDGNLPKPGEAESQAAEGMEALAELYQQSQGACKQCGGSGQGEGGQGAPCPSCQGQGGTGGEGKGKGGRPPENENATAQFTKERSPTQMRAGKILMQWETKEVSPKGEAKQAYDRAIDDIKEGVGEAIVREQIPAGYHGTIQNYFDDLSAEDLAAGEPPPAPESTPVP